MENNTITANEGQEKTIGIIAYLTLIGLIIAFVMNAEKKNAFTAYHIRQSLGLMCTGLALAFINIVPILGWVISLAGYLILLVMWVTGLMNAVNGRTKPVAVLGGRYEQWFKTI